jgi:uncharacterized protein
MRLSRYAVAVQEESRVLAVSLLSRAAVELSSEAYEKLLGWVESGLPNNLSDNDRELVSFLAANLFVVFERFDELAFLKQRIREQRFLTRQIGLVIAPTMQCNFRCLYCFERHTEAWLDAHVEQRILAHVKNRLGTFDRLSVQWFGGEPLMAFDAVTSLSKSFLRMARTHDFEFDARVVTNGFLLDEETAATLSNFGVEEAQITLDGDRALHDQIRREKLEGPSFDRIVANVRSAADHLRILLRVHLTPASCDSVLALLDRLKQKELNQCIDSIYFAPLFDYRVGMCGPAYQVDEDRFASSEVFSKIEIRVLAKAYDLGFRVRDFLDVSYGICTAVRDGTVVVGPTGEMAKCYKDCGVPQESFGVIGEVIRNEDVLSKWLDVDVPRDGECAECRMLPICLGGCTKQWHEGASKDVICTPLLYNIEDRIRLYFRH